MLIQLLKTEKFSGIYNKIVSDTRIGIPNAVFGVGFSEKCRIISSLDCPTLFIVRDNISAQKTVEQINGFIKDKAVFLPAKDDVLLFKNAFNKDSLYKRLTALHKIKKGYNVVVATIESLIQLFPKNVEFLTFEKSGEYDLYNCIERLIKLGYKRVDFCENRGSFSVRGDILEIFPINEAEVFKIDFFGDFVEKIRKGSEEVDFLDVVMATDVIIDEEEIDGVIKSLKNAYSGSNLINKDGAKNIYSKVVEKLQSDLFDDCLQYVMPLIKNKTSNFFDLFYSDLVVAFDESKILYSQLLNLEKESSERIASLIRVGDGLRFVDEQLLKSHELLNLFANKKQIALQSLTAEVKFFNPLKTFNVKCTPLIKYWLDKKSLYSDLLAWQTTGYTVLILCDKLSRQENVYSDLNQNKINCTFLKEITQNVKGVNVAIYPLKTGFIDHETKLVVLGYEDVFAPRTNEKSIKKKRGDLFTAPNIGDYAVHENFGIGCVRGVKKISTVEGIKEYVELEYLGGDRLYVSTDQMDKLSKYLGGGENPKLNKIGNGEFERIKERVKNAIKMMTINLKNLYATRKEKKGFVFSEDNLLSLEFDNAFEFEETEDQLISIEEIKKDMQSSKVMDRLLCGDVGFGKTEVALRACFKAILDGKQCAIIAPTTILTEQHYQTAINRFKDFGVRIGVLNRFRTKTQIQNTLKKLKDGEIDLIIGTHRLFSKDVKFYDLGLLVIDEEQRFGVEHKERLKLLKENVDTLTLTATPIPRTLHLSLSGIRDISTINTPPKKRIPVQTFVVELTDSLIKDAINKELARKGQAFILYNRVESIYAFKERVQALVPQAKIVVAHGQMSERELENNVSAFYRGEGDVLIATTIIENGIDMPRANTLIVEGSDRLGLSTLYQLKGRVGRSNLLAYAYFTYSQDKVLTDQAYKRLSALMEYNEMGSGYKIAMRDLEIRGAGNVLGKEQHGNMDKIGYELYSKLLKEEMGDAIKDKEIELDVKADAYIPDDYIESQRGKMDAYKSIAEIKNEEDKKRVEKSLIDNYGKIPIEVQTLINIAELKGKAKEVNAVKIILSQNGGKLYLNDFNDLKDGKITSKIPNYRNRVSLYFEEKPILFFNTNTKNARDILYLMIEFLTF